MHPLKVARAAVEEHGALQKTQELASFLALIADIDPQVIVEIGSDVGGTLWAWQQLNPRRVIGVDLPGGKYSSGIYVQTADGRRLNSHGCEVVIGDSHDMETMLSLQALLGDDLIDVLFIDGDHSYDGVKQDFEMYSPFVRPGGIIGCHDICNHNRPDVQVDRWWRGLNLATEDIVTAPATWGGIGVVRVPVAVAA